jgi:hypothetical protein
MPKTPRISNPDGQNDEFWGFEFCPKPDCWGKCSWTIYFSSDYFHVPCVQGKQLNAYYHLARGKWPAAPRRRKRRRRRPPTRTRCEVRLARGQCQGPWGDPLGGSGGIPCGDPLGGSPGGSPVGIPCGDSLGGFPGGIPWGDRSVTRTSVLKLGVLAFAE